MKFKRCQCGSETFYMRQNVTGTIDYPEYYRCIECDKRAKEVQDDTKI
ncbi:hypothetical protein [Streptococcus constellatus]|nr:hypothetical protein [Streptococcus constellatus]